MGQFKLPRWTYMRVFSIVVRRGSNAKRSVSLNIPFPVSKFDLPAGSSQKYRLYAICVDSRFYLPWGNTTLWDWDEELFRFKFREVWKFRFAARVMFYACWFSLPNQNAFSSLSRSSNYFEKVFLIHSGVFSIVNWKCGVFIFVCFRTLIRGSLLVARWFTLLTQHIFSRFYFYLN